MNDPVIIDLTKELTKRELQTQVQERADKLYFEELYDLFNDPESVREAFVNMNTEALMTFVKSYPIIWMEVALYLKPFAKEHALKRAERELET